MLIRERTKTDALDRRVWQLYFDKRLTIGHAGAERDLPFRERRVRLMMQLEKTKAVSMRAATATSLPVRARPRT